MTYQNRQALHQHYLDSAVANLERAFLWAAEAEDSDEPIENLEALYFACRRWSIVASLILATGVEDTRYADN